MFCRVEWWGCVLRDGADMTLIGTAEPRNNSTLGGSHLAGFTASIVLGSEIFIIERKLACARTALGAEAGE